MKEIGIISENRGNEALVTIQRHAACGDCGACHIGREKATMETVAKNPLHAQKGESVEVEMEFVSVFKASFIAYGIPLIAFIVGCVLAYLIVDLLKLNFDLVLSSFFTGLLLMLFSYLVIRQVDKKGNFSGPYTPIITAVIPPIEEGDKTPEEKKLGF